MSQNPFLEETFHVRWSAMKATDVEPAVSAALDSAEASLRRIEAAGPVSFEATFLALDEASARLSQVWGRVAHLQSVCDEPELRAAHNLMFPKVSTFLAGIPLRPALWSTLKAFAESPAAAALAPVRARYVRETVAEFRDAGADLPPDKKERLEQIQAELSKVTQKFSDHVLDATNAWQLLIEDEARLAGIPQGARDRARADAASRGLCTPGKPVWRFTLHQPSLEPVLKYADDRTLREEAWRASVAVGGVAPNDNLPLIARILELRSEKAALLGRANFADLVLSRRMAKSGAAALAFVDGLKERCAAPFARECRELETFAAEGTGLPPRALAPWDIAYHAERLRRGRYSFDEEQLRPYFAVANVMAGLFEVTRRVFGIRVLERPGIDVWHGDVRFYDVFEASGGHIGSFYADWHPRESKRGGAWMNPLATGGPLPSGSRTPHLGVICGNMTPPLGERPALLSHREVETIFHEFGHLLHLLFGALEIKSLTGLNVAWDFVELPSQIMENWCWERESLDLFARHHQTGEPIPQALFEKMLAARTFRAASATMRQVSFGREDLVMHMKPVPAGADLDGWIRESVADCLIPTQPPMPTITKRFTHLFGDPVGYAGGYYSYKWSEVLDADAFTRFKREGIFNGIVGKDFVDKILSRGNADDADRLFREFMGRDPDLTALLVRSGLAA